MTREVFVLDSRATLEQLPIRFFPKPKIRQTISGARTRFEPRSQHTPLGFMPLGAYSYSHSFFPATWIGRYCSIAPNVRVMGHSHPVSWVTSSPVAYKQGRRKALGVAGPNLGLIFDEAIKPVTIGHDVWIGQDVLLKGGINIGNGAIIAAGAIVVRDVAPYTVVGGTPAKFIKPRFAPDISQHLQDLNWWDYTYECLQLLDFSDPAKFIATFPPADKLVALPERRLTVFEMRADFAQTP